MSGSLHSAGQLFLLSRMRIGGGLPLTYFAGVVGGPSPTPAELRSVGAPPPSPAPMPTPTPIPRPIAIAPASRPPTLSL
jgi:hypothetical protein